MPIKLFEVYPVFGVPEVKWKRYGAQLDTIINSMFFSATRFHSRVRIENHGRRFSGTRIPVKTTFTSRICQSKSKRCVDKIYQGTLIIQFEEIGDSVIKSTWIFALSRFWSIFWDESRGRGSAHTLSFGVRISGDTSRKITHVLITRVLWRVV